MDENVDILLPPDFKPSGVIKPREQAFDDEDWIGTFNLWIVRKEPEPAILYQQRSLAKSWAPGLMDIAAAGHYQAGEFLADGLREAVEELSVRYAPEAITHLGKKIYVGPDVKGRMRNNAVDVYLIEDGSPLTTYKLQKEEVEAVCILPVRELLKIHRDPAYQFTAQALNNQREDVALTISKSSFPYNFDDYHYKMAVIADRYFRGDKDLLY